MLRRSGYVRSLGWGNGFTGRMIFAARWRTPSLVRQGMIRQLKPLPWPAPASLFWLPPKNDTAGVLPGGRDTVQALTLRSDEHTSELQSLMRISYAVFCLKNKNPN